MEGNDLAIESGDFTSDTHTVCLGRNFFYFGAILLFIEVDIRHQIGNGIDHNDRWDIKNDLFPKVIELSGVIHIRFGVAGLFHIDLHDGRFDVSNGEEALFQFVLLFVSDLAHLKSRDLLDTGIGLALLQIVVNGKRIVDTSGNRRSYANRPGGFSCGWFSNNTYLGSGGNTKTDVTIFDGIVFVVDIDPIADGIVHHRASGFVRIGTYVSIKNVIF